MAIEEGVDVRPKQLYIVSDNSIWQQTEPNYFFVVKACGSKQAIEIVKKHVKDNKYLNRLDWTAKLADNTTVLE